MHFIVDIFNQKFPIKLRLNAWLHNKNSSISAICHNLLPLTICVSADIVIADKAFFFRHDLLFFRASACRPTNVECSKRKLSARLTDTLCSQYPNSFTGFNHLRLAKIQSITLRTHTLWSLTSYRSAYHYRFNICFLNAFCHCHINKHTLAQ